MIIRSDIRTLKLLMQRFLRPYLKSIVALAGLSTIVGFLTSLRPLVLAPALEAFLGTRSAPAASLGELSLNNLGATLIGLLGLDVGRPMVIGAVVAVMFVLVSTLTAGLAYGIYAGTQRTRTYMLRDMMTTLHAHLLSMPLAFFHKRKIGELVSRITNDTAKATHMLDSVVRSLLRALAQVLITLTVLFKTDAMFTATVLGLGSAHMIVTRALAKQVRSRVRKWTTHYSVANAALFESLSGIRLIKSFAAEKADAKRIYGVVDELRNSELRYRLISSIEDPVRLVTDALVIGAVLVLIFLAVQEGRLTLPAAAMFFFLAQQLLGPVSEVAKQFLALQTLLGSSAHVLDLLQLDSNLQDGRKVAGPLREEIVLKGVSFSYEPARPVLRDIDLTIRRGEIVALVGPSGAGKSTLADLILRFYDVGSGCIRYDGTDIREFSQETYRGCFGVVAQESLLFSGTVRENIVFYRDETEKDLDHAIWVANADEFVKHLPGTLDATVGDRGVRLSGGQRQRVAIARAVYGRPGILVLDEATSALDSASERAVQKAIDRIAEEMTMIIIAHRLSTITHADKIVVLNHGRIEAVGRHDDLMTRSDTYRRLNRIQSSLPDEDGAPAVAEIDRSEYTS